MRRTKKRHRTKNKEEQIETYWDQLIARWRRHLPHLLRAADLCYDIISLIINIADVASDVLVCIMWYQKQRYVLFWITIATFFIAHVAHAGFFTIFYAEKKSRTYIMMCFFLVFPFAQLVPLVIWIQGYNWAWLNSKMTQIGLDVSSSDPVAEDPYRSYILKKIKVHGGFIIEGLVEGIPQSIIQMVALVMYSESDNVLEVVSLSLSLLSVASRGFVLAYCIDRPTSAFNFVCFVTDVFGVFAVVSWLFVPLTSEVFYTVPFLPTLKVSNFASLIWVYAFALVAIVAASLGVSLFWLAMSEAARRAGARGIGKYLQPVVLFFGGIILFPAVLVAVRAVVMSFFPLVIFEALDPPHTLDLKFYHNLFQFLREAPNEEDYHLRSFLTQRTFARRFAETYGLTAKDDFRANHAFLLTYPTYHRALEILRYQDIIPPYKPKGVLGTIKDSVLRYRKSTQQNLSSVDLKSEYVAAYIARVVFVPVVLGTSILSAVFPIIAVFSTPRSDISNLQLVLSIAYFCCLAMLLALSPWVLRFFKLKSSVQMYDRAPQSHHLQTIKSDYLLALEAARQEHVARVGGNWGRVSVIVASMASTGFPKKNSSEGSIDTHILSLIPEIDQFAGHTRSHNQSDLSSFLQSTWLTQLLDDKAMTMRPPPRPRTPTAKLQANLRNRSSRRQKSK